MNSKVNLNSEILKELIDNNRPFFVPIATMFVGIILIIFFVIPQFNGFSAKQAEIDSEKAKLVRLNRSLSILSGTSDEVLSKDVSITSQALPPDKDFALILDAISSAASFSGVSLGDFDFQIGDISGGDQGSPTSVPSLKITINVTGSVESTNRFITELNKSVPISQVSAVKSGGNFSSIDIVFYFKPFPPKNSIDPQSISQIQTSEQKIIDGLTVPSAANTVQTSLPTSSL